MIYIRSLIPVHIINNVEAYIVLDKPGYKAGGEARINLLMRSINGRCEKVECIVRDHTGNIIWKKNIEVCPKPIDINIEYNVPEKTGIYNLVLEINGKEIDKIEYIVEDSSRRKPVLFTIVWHHHQAPNYLPDKRIHGPWAYIYVWGNQLNPYGKGPYHYHAVMLRQHPGFKSTYNLSPSLLAQWKMIIEEGVVFENGKRYSPDSTEANIVRETLRLYREALEKKQIEVLSSIYAHTIAGFLIDVLGMTDIVEEEIEYGKLITKEVIGEKYEPRGIWTPEMAFSMKLVNIYNKLGLEYTVLDDQHHFVHAKGEKNGPYQPYLLIDRSTGRNIIVFFRDHVLSDILGFRNTFNSEIHAWRNAYETSYLILKKWFDHRIKTLVLALDGENWMVFSKTPPLTSYFLDKLVIYLETLDDLGFLKLSTLSDIIDNYPPRKILYHIPTNTWLGTFRKWRGEVNDHEKYWRKTYMTYRRLKAYEEIISGHDNYSRRIRWALWHALDSDYWWAEFWNPRIIDTWLKQANQLLDERLSRVKITNVGIEGEVYENTEAFLTINIFNELDREANMLLEVSGLDNIDKQCRKIIKIGPRNQYSEKIKYIPRSCGHSHLIIRLLSANYVIDEKILDIEIKPYIPKNPV